MVGYNYNPHKPGRPSHCYHTYLMANLRLVLGVDVQPGNEHTPKHGQAGLWTLLHRLGRAAGRRWCGRSGLGHRPGDVARRTGGLAYLFRLRMTANVKRALTADPACRAGNADHQQHARRTTQGAPRLSADRPLPGAAASNCGAVGSSATVASYTQRSAQTLPEGPPT